MESTYFEVRTSTGTIVQQFVDKPVMDRWFARMSKFNYTPEYHVFKITKREELCYVQPDHKATTA